MVAVNYMAMINDPIPIAKLVQKILVGKYEPIMGIFRKIFIINLHNLQMLFMLWIKYRFSECLALSHKYEGPEWKTFWRRFFPRPHTEGDPEAITPKYFLCRTNFVWLRKICFKRMIKTKIFPH